MGILQTEREEHREQSGSCAQNHENIVQQFNK